MRNPRFRIRDGWGEMAYRSYDEYELLPDGAWRFLRSYNPIRPLAPGCLAQSKVKHRGWRKR